MRRNKRDFGRLILIAIFLFVAVLLPNLINAISRAAGTLGTFAAGETGIKLCATISGGNEDALRFNVTNNQGFQADVVVPADTCKNIHTEAATYHIRQYVSQEYAIDSVSGGTISADDSDFVATASGQYSIVYSNTYSQKPYLHNFGYTSSATASSAVEVTFDANGGTGTMAPQNFGINSQQTLTTNTFTRTGFSYDGWNTKADGTGTSYVDEQALTFATGGELQLFAQWKEIPTLYKTVASRPNNGEDTNFDFSQVFQRSGINIRSGTASDEYPIYYFRGIVNTNNVIWANHCWKIMRTTDTGGTKLVYNGEPTVVDGSQQCLATGTDAQIALTVDGVEKNTFKFNDEADSAADVGYMYGERIKNKLLKAADTDVFTFANDVTRNNDGTYTLSTGSDEQGPLSITGTWVGNYSTISTRHHYFCTNGATTCSGNEIGYIVNFLPSNIVDGGRDIYYYNIGGYDDIEDLKDAMFANVTDSNAKKTIESWFEDKNLDGHISGTRNYEDDLEDVVYCNERVYGSGAMAGKDSKGDENSYSAGVFIASIRTWYNNFNLSLGCANNRDSFTKDDIENGNGLLRHKIGLISQDELALAGFMNIPVANNYLNSGQLSFSMGPQDTNVYVASNYGWDPQGRIVVTVNGEHALRPMVSLKNSMTILDNGATGTTTNPYIVE